ncbi:unnamed protein product [Vitrella brassicaformis CCMP3155]|uniref:Uncharacterized protein n=1 Tax=Vitrella brassicaformis (strain CCMP3155) TaxID=1169540 RepID=A0A0G4ET04_VITBC|nr:unnamed protein product [Vitrella brassicaformis CCMP3155]|eukprot:CEM01015.1 unnamed protein product [Vitrella brassicaformis CCMP3155]
MIRLLKDKLRAERDEWARKEKILEQELLRVCREKSEINKELTAVNDDNKNLLDKLQVLSGLHLQPLGSRSITLKFIADTSRPPPPCTVHRG